MASPFQTARRVLVATLAVAAGAFVWPATMALAQAMPSLHPTVILVVFLIGVFPAMFSQGALLPITSSLDRSEASFVFVIVGFVQANLTLFFIGMWIVEVPPNATLLSLNELWRCFETGWSKPPWLLILYIFVCLMSAGPALFLQEPYDPSVPTDDPAKRGRQPTPIPLPLPHAGGGGMIEAVRLGDFGTVASQLARGTNPNEPDLAGNTALMYAAQANDHVLVELLLRHGADPLWKNSTGSIAADYTSSRKVRQSLASARNQR